MKLAFFPSAKRAAVARLFTLAGGLLLAACSQLPLPPAQQSPVWLLGEVHDNPEGHRQRFAWLQQQLMQGWRPAIALEQFDREQQPLLDMAQRDCPDAACLLGRVAGEQQWQWSFYAPVIDLALQQRLPLLAANLSRADAGKVMRQGYGAALGGATITRFRLDQPPADDLWAAQRKEIIDSHCGKLPQRMVDGMVQVQIARDVWMAQVLSQHADRNVVLLAGNGHVRRDLGVPYWLRQQGMGESRSIGFVETDAEGEFDISVRIPAQPRPDPCAELADMPLATSR